MSPMGSNTPTVKAQMVHPPPMAIWTLPTPCYLADKQQWGSKGAIDYQRAALKKMIAEIMKLDINHQTWSIILCDGVESESKDYFDTRSSDFMPSHFKAFAQVTHDKRWIKVIDANYRLF